MIDQPDAAQEIDRIIRGRAEILPLLREHHAALGIAPIDMHWLAEPGIG